jgi:RNA polymerase sigma factor (sigma-70 family)
VAEGADSQLDERFRREMLAALPRLVRLAHRLTPPGVDHEDLVQDVLERAWRSRSRFRGGSQITTWLHRIMVNHTIDLTRRTVPEPVGSELELDIAGADLSDPLEALARAEDAEQLRAALSRLDPLARTLLVLRDGEGWPAAELAELCSLSEEAVHKRVQRARLRLARELSSGRVSVARPAPACIRTRAAAQAYIDGTLDRQTRERVERHLTRCERCPPLLQALVGLRAVLQAEPAPGRVEELETLAATSLSRPPPAPAATPRTAPRAPRGAPAVGAPRAARD